MKILVSINPSLGPLWVNIVWGAALNLPQVIITDLHFTCLKGYWHYYNLPHNFAHFWGVCVWGGASGSKNLCLGKCPQQQYRKILLPLVFQLNFSCSLLWLLIIRTLRICQKVETSDKNSIKKICSILMFVLEKTASLLLIVLNSLEFNCSRQRYCKSLESTP